MNAFTAKEYTCYYARVLDDDLPLAVDVVCDMVTSSLITRRGRRGRARRDPRRDRHARRRPDRRRPRRVRAGALRRPPARPAGARHASSRSSAIGRGAIDGYYRRALPAAGHGRRGRRQRRPRHGRPAGAQGVRRGRHARRRRGADPARAPGAWHPHRAAASRVVRRPTEQANLVLGGPGVARTDERRFALGVLNAALGGGMSSRLFQEVREKRGLAYSVYSYTRSTPTPACSASTPAACRARSTRCSTICREELAKVARDGITAEEIAARQGPAARLARPRPRGHRLADEPHRQGRARATASCSRSTRCSARIDAVTLDDVRAVAADLLDRAADARGHRPVRRRPRLRRGA